MSPTQRCASLLVLGFVVGLGQARPAQADKWGLPEKQAYFSVDRMFRFTVLPASPFAGTDLKSDDSRTLRPAASGHGRCQGTLERLEPNGRDEYQVIWSRPLIHGVAPVRAKVSDDGKY